MKKAELVDLIEGSLVGQLVGLLPEWSELVGLESVNARLALQLAAGIDGGGDLASAAHVKEFRGVLSDLEEMFGGSDDEAAKFWAAMSAELGDSEVG